MTSPRVLLALAVADFRERARRTGFWMTIGLAVYLGYTVNAGYWVMRLGGYRGELSSAWVGTLAALVTGTMLSWLGFFVVRQNIERDRRTGVGQILAATPMSRFEYTLGKTLSNFAVLAAMVGVLAIAAVITALTSETTVEIGDLLLPILLFTIPLVAATGAVAVLFETTPGLSGAAGNVVYFLLWAMALVASIESGIAWADFTGFGIVYASQLDALLAQVPDAEVPGMSLQLFSTRGTESFAWNGVVWTPALVATRGAWLLSSIAIAAIAALPFDRFAGTASRGLLGRGRADGRSRGPHRAAIGAAGTAADFVVTRAPSPMLAYADLPEMQRGATNLRMIELIAAELKLMIRGRAWWWYAGLVGLAAGQALAPLEAVRAGVVVGALIWPAFVVSELGCRDCLHRTTALLGSAPRPLLRQLPAAWFAGFALVLVAVTVGALRFVAVGRADVAGALVCAALFVPSLALALGALSGTPRVFEVVYLLLWYVGPLNRVPALDFLGGTDGAVSWATPATFAAMAPVLLALAVWGRRRRHLDE